MIHKIFEFQTSHNEETLFTLFKDDEYAFWLDSNMEDSKYHTISIMGSNPQHIFEDDIQNLKNVIAAHNLKGFAVGMMPYTGKPLFFLAADSIFIDHIKKTMHFHCYGNTKQEIDTKYQLFQKNYNPL